MTSDTEKNHSEQPGLNDLISLRKASELSGLSASQLRLLVSRGIIWGVKLGRNWVTTAESVTEYLAQDRRPGPKPKKPRNSQESS